MLVAGAARTGSFIFLSTFSKTRRSVGAVWQSAGSVDSCEQGRQDVGLQWKCQLLCRCSRRKAGPPSVYLICGRGQPSGFLVLLHCVQPTYSKTPSTLHPCHLPSFFCWMGHMDGPSPPRSGESSLGTEGPGLGQASEVPSARSPALQLYTGTFQEPATWVILAGCFPYRKDELVGRVSSRSVILILG